MPGHPATSGDRTTADDSDGGDGNGAPGGRWCAGQPHAAMATTGDSDDSDDSDDSAGI